MKRYSKRVREEAALICAIAASMPGLNQDYGSVVYALGIEWPESQYESRSKRLAFEAWKIADSAQCEHPDAEAEALIRTGWSPPNG